MLHGLVWTPKNLKRRGDQRHTQAHLTVLNQFPSFDLHSSLPRRLKIRLRHYFFTRGYSSPLRYLFLSLLLYRTPIHTGRTPVELTWNKHLPTPSPKLPVPAVFSWAMRNRSSPMAATLKLFYFSLMAVTLPYNAKTTFNVRLTLTYVANLVKVPFAPK